MSGYALKVLNDAKAQLDADVASVAAQIATMQKQIDEDNAAIAELDAAIITLTPPADPTEAQPA
jgi:peptidoglycan hydrolase CwlO-like protein